MRPGAVAAALLLAVACVDAVIALRGLSALDGFARAARLALLALGLVLVSFAALLLASIRAPALPPAGDAPAGAVDVVVPVRNEDAGVLRATLRAAKRMRAPPGGFSLLVVDDSDEARAPALARACAEEGVAYARRDARRGYKAGALNDALQGRDAPFVAVLDVDHEPAPGFLVETMGRFAPGVAYVQAVVEWRNDDTLLRRLAALLQRQFYYGVQMEKGSRERAVFTGSAAVFRREAVDAVGGFPEDTLVEDFDMTLRLANAGWRGRFAPVVGARGLLPWTARDLARQLWRWSHGTSEVLRLRWRETLRAKGAPWGARAELLADGGAYLAGGLLAGLYVLAAALAVAAPQAAVPWWSLLLAPAAIGGAHVASAAAALRARGGARSDAWLLPAYHLVSLAFTPVLLASSVAGLLAVGRGREGRVEKARARGGAPASSSE